MLGKLLKYEYKESVKMYCCLYAFGLLLSIVALVFSLLDGHNPGAPFLMTAKTFTYGMLVLMVVIIFSVTLIYAVLRYRKNLLKDEGYLMHTLPVHTRDLVFSKLIVSVSWFVLDAIVAYILLALPNRKFGAVHEFLVQYANVSTEFGVSKSVLAVFSIIFFLAAVVASLAQFYLCLSIGYTSYGNKDLMSFVSYIVLYVVMQIISGIMMLIVTFSSFKTLNFVDLDEYGNAPAFVKAIMLGSLCVSVIVSAVEIFGSIKLMDKKLNLE